MSIYYESLDELLTGLRVIEADPDVQATPPPAIYLCTLYDPIRYVKGLGGLTCTD